MEIFKEFKIEELIPASEEDFLKKVDEIVNVQKTVQADTYPNPQYDLTKEDILNEPLNVEECHRNWLKGLENWGKSSFGLLVYNEENKLIAFSTAYRKGSKETNNEKIWLGNIFVLKEYQGKHIGSELMKRIINWAGNLPIVLSVVAYNENARKFYEYLGFRYFSDGEEINYNGKSIPQVCMIKE